MYNPKGSRWTVFYLQVELFKPGEDKPGIAQGEEQSWGRKMMSGPNQNGS
jgi:hypothetical protein